MLYNYIYLLRTCGVCCISLGTVTLIVAEVTVKVLVSNNVYAIFFSVEAVNIGEE